MRGTSPPEERYPLLLLFLEDGQRRPKETRKIFFDKGRYQGITSGVTTVITQWPGHLATCLTTALFIGLVIILFSLLMLIMSITPAANFLTARCKNHVYQQNNLTTIVHLVHGPRPWSQSELDTLEEIVKRFGSSNIDLIMIQNRTESFTNARIKNSTATKSPLIKTPVKSTVSQKNSNKNNGIFKVTQSTKNSSYPIQFNINIGTNRLLRMLFDSSNFIKRQRVSIQNITSTTDTLTRRRNISELLQKYPDIFVQSTTYEEVFKHTPLILSWQALNEPTRLFAIRVMQIWDHAGVTFDVSEVYKSQSANRTSDYLTSTDLDKYKGLISSGMVFFQNLPEGLVTVDDKGLHMETKTVCHAFFGEILMKLRTSKYDTTPATVIQDTLRSFCRRGAVDVNYCKRILI